MARKTPRRPVRSISARPERPLPYWRPDPGIVCPLKSAEWGSDLAVKQLSNPPCQRVVKVSKPTLNYMIYQELLEKIDDFLPEPLG